MNKNNITPGAKELLHKYLQHQCTPEEEQQVLRWYFSFTKEDDLLRDEEEQEKILQSVKQKVLLATTGNKSKFSGQNNTPLNYTWLKVAALLAILLSAAFFGFYRYQGKSSSLQEFRTAAAQRKTITLTDGTRIWLNNASVLRYPVKFGSRTREVELEGEAFFEVAHHAARPFLVHTRGLRVQVLGTSFNVSAYAADKDITVNVATGKVAVISDLNTVMLKRAEGIVYNRRAKSFLPSAEDTGLSRAWQNNTLYFRYQTLENISLRLERWYGVKFSIKNERLMRKKYTLEQHNETLDNVMKVLSAGEFSYKITGNAVAVW
jgi:transmembrane sensor